MEKFAEQRKHMVKAHLKRRGISDPLVLKAFSNVPREKFIPESWQSSAYEDRPLPIGEGQTISQPFIVALMTEALGLKEGQKVLEIGTGSGYAAAILGEMGLKVYTIERHKSLADAARKKLKSWKNVTVIHGDGTRGYEKEAPFDGIVTTAAGPRVPKTLKNQLKVGGKLVIPVGRHPRFQSLLKLTRKTGDKFAEEDLGPVAFVPLIGSEGFESG